MQSKSAARELLSRPIVERRLRIVFKQPAYLGHTAHIQLWVSGARAVLVFVCVSCSLCVPCVFTLTACGGCVSFLFALFLVQMETLTQVGESEDGCTEAPSSRRVDVMYGVRKADAVSGPRRWAQVGVLTLVRGEATAS